MTADISYTVKHHPTLTKKIGFGFGALGILFFPIVWLTVDLPNSVTPSLISHLSQISLGSFVFGIMLLQFKWRRGKIELTNDKLTINGSYRVSIWLKNMWEVDIRDLSYQRWTVRLDSNVEAVQVKFKTEKEFEDFSEKLI